MEQEEIIVNVKNRLENNYFELFISIVQRFPNHYKLLQFLSIASMQQNGNTYNDISSILDTEPRGSGEEH